MGPSLPILLSPTQHDTISTCWRKWGFRYLDGIKAPQKKSAALGEAVHKVLETYYLERTLPVSDEIGRIALPALQHLPTPHPSLEIEAAFEETMAPGVVERGKIDLLDLTRETGFQVGDDWPTHVDGNPIPLVIDHKTTTDFRWMKSPEVLRGVTRDDGAVMRGDPQPLIYGLVAARRHAARYGAPPVEVHFRWSYMRTSGEPSARPVDLRLTHEEILSGVESYLPDAEAAMRLRNMKIRGAELPPTPSACGKYGGCDYGAGRTGLDICRLTDGERMRAAMTSPLTPGVKVAHFFNGAGAPPVIAGPSPYVSPNPPEAQKAAWAQTPAPPAAAPAAMPASPWMQAPIAAPAAPAKPQIPAHVPPEQHAAYLLWCEQNGMDVATGQPKAAAPVASPAPAHPPKGIAMPSGAVSMGDGHYYGRNASGQPVQATSWEGLTSPTTAPAQAAAPAASASVQGPPREGPAVTLPGVDPAAVAAAKAAMGTQATQAPPAVAVEAKKRGRPKKEAKDTSTPADKSRRIVLTQAAITELIGFLETLLDADDVDGDDAAPNA